MPPEHDPHMASLEMTRSPEARPPIIPPSVLSEICRDERPLTETAQNVLACSACLERNELPVTAKAVGGCRDIGYWTVRYNLQVLERRDIVAETGTRRGGVYALSDEARQNMPLESPADCRAEQLRARQSALTDVQQRVLDCLACQSAHEMTPDRARVQKCTSLSRIVVRRATATLVKRGIIEVGELMAQGVLGPGKPRGFSIREDVGVAPTPVPGCELEGSDAGRIYERFSDARKRVLGCLACIAGKTAQGLDIPGASRKMLFDCTGLSYSLIDSFMETLVQQDFYKRVEGDFNQTQFGRPFFTPSVKGTRLLGKNTLQVDQCWLDIAEPVGLPVQVRDAIMRCSGCIWTQQVAAQQSQKVTARMIAECSGLSKTVLTSKALPELVQSGYFRRARGVGHSYVYAPTSQSRVMLGPSAVCNLNLYKDKDAGELLTPLPDDVVLERPDDNRVFQEFQHFIDDLNGEYSGDADSWIYGAFKETPLLSAEEESYLALIVQYSPDERLVQKAINRFMSSNIRLAIWMAKRMRFEAAVTTFPDVVQLALIGIHEAAQRFDPLVGGKFSTYAFWRMKASIAQGTADAVGASRSLTALIPVTLWRIHEFENQNHRKPSIVELAASAGMQTKKIQAILATYAQISERALDRALSVHDQRTLHDRIGVGDDESADTVLNDLFTELRRYLAPVERDLLDNVILAGTLSLGDYATKYGLTPEKGRKEYQRVLSLTRHPFFAIGAELDEAALGWQAKAECRNQGQVEVLEDKQGQVRRSRVAICCDRCLVRDKCEQLGRESKPRVSVGLWGGVHASRLTPRDVT